MAAALTLPEALAIIDAAADRSSKVQGADDETLEALRWLWRHDSRPAFRETLAWFKDSLDGENYIGRYQNANAARNRIRWLLGEK